MRLRYLLMGLCLLWTAPGYAATSTTLQSAAVADGVGTAATVFDYGEIALHVDITGKASVNFEGSADSGTTYSAIVCRRGGSTSGDVSTTNSSGLFFCYATGITNIRAPVKGWQTGTVTVSANVPGDTNGGVGTSLTTLLAGEAVADDVLKVEMRGYYTNITLAAPTTTVIKSGPGWLQNIIINKAVATGVITCYDNTAASGAVIATITQPAAVLASQIVLPYQTSFSVGLTCVTATAAQDITVVVR